MSEWTLRLDGAELPGRALIGGKAWSIARMRALGLPVPPAFVVTTRACLSYLADGGLPAGLMDEVEAGVRWLEGATARTFGRGPRPLLLSVRSGAAVSMPGMMDTVLNLGVDAATEAALAAETDAPAFARDTHRRFVELFAAIVLKAPLEGASGEPEAMIAAAERDSGLGFPRAPADQLEACVRAVFDSWNTRRARRYREHNGIAHDLGTAVTVQAMVFGNLDERSGTGVLFSRDPLTGARRPYGEYLPRAQGEDVVSGKRTPLPLDAMLDSVPGAHATLLAAAETLEREHRDVQDIEFTVQQGTLYLLQARSAKRAPAAAVRIAIEMVDEGLIDPAAALDRVAPEQVRTLLSARLAEGTADGAAVLARGEGACPGVGIGVAVGDPDEAERRAAAGEAVVLVRRTTSPDDVHGMIAAKAVVTGQGGATSHAAVVSRALGRPAVVGCGDAALAIAGRTVTVDGGGGRVYEGALAVVEPDEAADPALRRLTEWARAASPVAVMTPGDPGAPADAVDLDAHPDAAEPGRLAALLQGAAAARGAVLAGEAGAADAVRAGVRTIVTRPVLPALLAAVRAARAGGAAA